jgi:hypothetical protein
MHSIRFGASQKLKTLSLEGCILFSIVKLTFSYVFKIQVNQVPYPLRLKALGRQGYFQQREEWKVTDILMNPMILMMVLPLLVNMLYRSG